MILTEVDDFWPIQRNYLRASVKALREFRQGALAF
jgi:hypothetical protein